MTAPADIPKLGDRSLFPELRSLAYLNHAAISPVSEPVRRAAQRALSDLAQAGSVAFPERLAERQALREDLAQLMNARSSRELAFVPSTLYGLGVLATSIPWRKRMRVIAFDGEYPTNVSVWQRACQQHDLALCMSPVSDFAHAAGPDLSALERELRRGDVQLCAVSAVQFQTGLRMPLERIAQLCHAHGAQLAVDAVQALGLFLRLMKNVPDPELRRIYRRRMTTMIGRRPDPNVLLICRGRWSSSECWSTPSNITAPEPTNRVAGGAPFGQGLGVLRR